MLFEVHGTYVLNRSKNFKCDFLNIPSRKISFLFRWDFPWAYLLDEKRWVRQAGAYLVLRRKLKGEFLHPLVFPETSKSKPRKFIYF